MRVLITGGAGFIGQNLVRHLEAEGDEVAVVDDYSRGRIDDLNGTRAAARHQIGNGDVCDCVEDEIDDVDAVVHAACRPITAAITNPVEAFRTNTLGTMAVAFACAQAKIPMIYLSSASVYGDGTAPARLWREIDVHSNVTRGPYAASKLAGELAVASAVSAYGLIATTLRLSNVYGPGQHPDDRHTGVVARFLDGMLRARSITINGDGAQTRDFTYVDDVCRAVYAALYYPTTTVMNIGTGRETSIVALAEMARQAAGSHGLRMITSVPLRPTDTVHRRAVDPSRARTLLDWKPAVCLEDGLKRTAAWLRERI